MRKTQPTSKYLKKHICLFRNISVLICIALLSLSLQAAGNNDSFRFIGYSGGMMVHGGYIQSNIFTIHSGAISQDFQIKGFGNGLGGTAKFNFGTEHDQLRIGMEGYGTKVAYKPKPSYSRIGWGGLTLDYIHQSKKGRVHPFIGCTIGGGGVKNHLLSEGSASDFEAEAIGIMHKYAFFTVTPFVGIEISIAKRVRVVIKADYLTDLSGNSPDFPSGIRLYAGILFSRLWK